MILRNSLSSAASHIALSVGVLHDIVRAMKNQKRGKSPGPDGIPMEAFIFGGKKLHLHLSLLFNLFLHHGYLPDIFCQAVIIPLVECKTGDLSDVNNTTTEQLQYLLLCRKF